MNPLILLALIIQSFAQQCATPGCNRSGGKVPPQNQTVELSSYPFSNTIYQDGVNQFQIYWDIQSKGQNNETLRMNMRLLGTGITTAYVAIGFGSSMLTTKEFIVCHLYPDKHVEIRKSRVNAR